MMRRYPVLNLGQSIPEGLRMAIERLSAEWLGKFGVVSIGDGYRHGRWVLEVRATGDPGALAWALPTEFMGYPVEVLPSGEIRPQ
jgi:hypothetical protein